MQTYESRDALVGVRPGGCIQPFLQSFAERFVIGGYARLVTRDYVRAAAHFGRWMDSQHVGPRDLTDAIVARFEEHHCRCIGTYLNGQRPSRKYVKRVRRFVDYLRSVGAVPSIPPPPAHTIPDVLIEFREWMIQHRGLAEPTMKRYERLVSSMLPALGDDPSRYDAALIRRVLLDQVRGLGRVYAKTFVCALRAFLKFLAVEGRCRSGLDRAVPTLPDWHLATLPRYLEPSAVERLIASCDLRTPGGIRDRAILLLLARLALRAGDVAGLRLDDLDWDAGTVRFRGKRRMEARLPLPQDVGDAILHYLVHARPACEFDQVFLCANAPIRPFATSVGVTTVVRLALKRAHIPDPPSKGAHLLRHSAATAMVRAGASLDAIATLLRHASTDSTAYYAKVDVELLRRVAQPWPEVPRC
jgi:site-specific recombinase XerD